MAWVLALTALSAHLPANATRTQIRGRVMGIAIPALLPLGSARGGQHIDYAAHVGGALLGLALGWLLLKLWKNDQPTPGFKKTSIGLSIALLAAMGISACAAISHYNEAAADFSGLIPASETQKSEMTGDQIDHLLADYPNDPRSHLLEGKKLAQTGDLASAEKEMRQSLEMADRNPLIMPNLRQYIRFSLADIFKSKMQIDSARQIAAPACNRPMARQVADQVASGLWSLLCER